MTMHATALACETVDPQDCPFAQDVISGLSNSPKHLNPKYFYDETGSKLFEQITQLPEYYPTRTELRILRDHGADIAATIPRNAALVEFGAGATTKVRLLLQYAAFKAYVPVDISGDFLNQQAEILRQDFPSLIIRPVTADFVTSFELPNDIAEMPRVGFFPGSTIGNFDPHEARAFLRSAHRVLGPGATLIVGVDLEKNRHVLERAYNDAAGVTGKFNQNVLVRINRQLGGNFDLSGFAHHALYNDEQHRIEMHLVSRKPQTVRLLGHNFAFHEGETIHTENSYKYSTERFAALARSSGWNLRRSWQDADGMFSVHTLTADGAAG